MTFPAITVVIPAHNRAATIGRAVSSVLGQSLSPAEIIVVDDGSTDGTAAAARRFTNSPISVKCLVSAKNAGAQAARNRGIRESRSDWVAFLDSDDEWAPNKLECQVNALRGNGWQPFTVVHSNCWRQHEDSGKREIWELPRIDGEDSWRRLLRGPGPMFQGMLTSKAALERIGLLDENVPSYQEWDTSILLARYCTFIHVREPLFIYHLHQNEMISRDTRRDLAGYQYVVEKHRDEMIRCSGEEVYAAHVVWNAVRAMYQGCFVEAVSYLECTRGISMKIVFLKSLAIRGKAPRLLCRWLTAGLLLDWQRQNIGA